MTDSPADPSSAPDLTDADRERVERLADAASRIRQEVARVIVGQNEVVDQLLLALFCRGHAILEGVPGLAKTLLVSTLARALDISFHRIQFTPDLMPSDITGTEVIQEDRAQGTRAFRFLPGPIFSHVVLADEINRTPPKTQAALLESMQERQVSVGGTAHRLPDPFFVLATQNPIEQEGTYPLPEAQQDRFLFKIFVTYPTWDEEFEVVRTTTAAAQPEITPQLGAAEMLSLQDLVRRIPVPRHVIHYAMSLVRATRVRSEVVPPFIKDWLQWGAGPRASQALVLTAKARAALAGRTFAGVEDIQAVAYPVLRHRILTTFVAEAEGITPDRVVDRLIETIPQKEGEILSDGRFDRLFQA